MDGYVRPKGQLTIPAQLRQQTDLKVGARVKFEAMGNGVFVRPVDASEDTREAFVSSEWLERIDRSIAEVEAGLERVYENEDDFLASLDE
jgi:AbrB family looped-hinge helix DNA binding protein